MFDLFTKTLVSSLECTEMTWFVSIQFLDICLNHAPFDPLSIYQLVLNVT